MRLELKINGAYFNSLDIEEAEFLNRSYRFDYRVNHNEERLDAYVAQVKALFFRQLAKAKSYEIVLVVPSNVNTIISEENTEQ